MKACRLTVSSAERCYLAKIQEEKSTDANYEVYCRYSVDRGFICRADDAFPPKSAGHTRMAEFPRFADTYPNEVAVIVFVNGSLKISASMWKKAVLMRVEKYE
jgi:hypothetical protein